MSRLSKAWRKTRLCSWWVSDRLPGMLIIGGQKCGTSALFKYLGQHPQLVQSKEKELDFFQSNLRYSYGVGWYANRWPRKARIDRIRFEASPAYLVSEEAPARIRYCLPQVKLIAILRDPVQRAYSAWQMYRRQLAETPDFYDRLWSDRYGFEQGSLPVRRTARELEDFSFAVEREMHMLERGEAMEWSVVQLGSYGPQLRRYFELFPEGQLLVLDSDDLRWRRVETLNRVLEFLGLSAWDWSQADLQNVFVGNWTTQIPNVTSDCLQSYYRDSNRILVEMLKQPPAFALQT
jgi:hypothetical protein